MAHLLGLRGGGGGLGVWGLWGWGFRGGLGVWGFGGCRGLGSNKPCCMAFSMIRSLYQVVALCGGGYRLQIDDVQPDTVALNPPSLVSDRKKFHAHELASIGLGF